MTGPTGRLYSYSDSGSRRVPLPEMWWFARECGRPDLIGGVERTVTLEAMRGPVGDLADADEYWRLEDEFRGVPPGTVFTWRMNTCAEAEAEGRTVHLSKNGKTVDVEAESGEWSIAKPDLSGQTPAPDLRQLQLRVAAEGADAAIRVRFRPGPRASKLHCRRGRGLLK